MTELGLKLNPMKTDISSEVVRSSIKDEKLAWMFRKRNCRNLQKRLLVIQDHSMAHPNSGILHDVLGKYSKRLSKTPPKASQVLPLISIVVDIAYKNPKIFPVSFAILSRLLDHLETEEEKQKVVEKVRRRFRQLPQTGLMEVWLQRISHNIAPDIEFKELLCRLVDQQTTTLWDNS